MSDETSSPLYFKEAGKKACAIGIAFGAVAVVTTLVFDRVWMMTVLAAFPFVGIGLAMRARPGKVRAGLHVNWESAWTATRGATRAVWLVGLLVGCSLGMLLWGVLVPYIDLRR